MKKIFNVLILSIALISCGEKEQQSQTLTEINLTFTDYDSRNHKSFLDLTIGNAISPTNKQLKISEDGTASYTFINATKNEVLACYDNRCFAVIVSPNETLNLELQISELTNSIKLKRFNVSGTNRETNTLILAHTFFLDSLIGQSTNAFTRERPLSDVDYKHKRISEMHGQLEILNEHLVKNQISDSCFIDWSKAQIKYSAGEDLSVFPFVGKINVSINDDDPYFRFIDEISSVNSDDLIYNTYLNYINSLSSTFTILSNISEKYANKRAVLTKDSLGNFPLKFDMLKRLRAGQVRDFLMAVAFQNEKRIPASYRDSLKHYAPESLIARLERTTEVEARDIVGLIKDYDISDKEKEELISLYANTKDKVIFHDFWFLNCAPCMKEIPHYNEFMTLAGEDVVFIMFGAYMEEAEWRNTISKHNLSGRHHLLTKNQLAFFELYFGLSGFPHHQIINSKGQIVKLNIPQVLPYNFEQLIKLIEGNRGM